MVNNIRSGCKDIWNASMVKDVIFTNHDIPFCPTTATELPKEIVTYEEAKNIYNKELRSKNHDFKYNAFVCWYLDDYKFDGPKGIWFNYQKAFNILQHFAGIITPDFSTCQDFPEPLKMYNAYRMRAFGYWYGKHGGSVINNVRWRTYETYEYCFNGISENSIVAIGSVASGLKEKKKHPLFIMGLYEMVKVLKPHTIIVYGSDKYPCFDILKQHGINIVAYPSKTSKDFARRKSHV